MTKRLMAALLCVAATFALGGVATAQAQGLSYKTAKGLATRLAEKQVRGRNVVSFHLLKARRVSSTRIVFPYDDRTTAHVFCTAVVIVDQAVTAKRTTIRARFSGQSCRGIPAEVLKFEAITRQTQRDLRGNTPATLAALAAVTRSTKRCRAVKVPKSAAGNAQALFDIAVVEALEGPNDDLVGGFSASLLLADVSNTTLHSGGVAWADYLATIRSLPAVPDPCAALKKWKAGGFAASAAPIDFAAYRA
ncbi:MAG: hypothetical protein QOC95_2040, partial [Thermoleophilaceae bacterium]|nr:hypothetical protein [Thermoleophilaceae bacterium]